jgi:phosphatidylserine/phosphatidylglycerophosphate/cardiolipin synthase-like enzyme
LKERSHEKVWLTSEARWPRADHKSRSMEALFTSLHSGDAIRQRLLGLVEEVSVLASSHRVDLHVMTFAFTDEEIADALILAAMRHASLTVRILADWSQRTRTHGQQVGRLAALDRPNLRVRYSLDQPYVWDSEAGHMRWSYHASRGLLHHKTLGVLVDGRPWKLACGSFNWTATAARSYENLLVVTAEDPGSLMLMTRTELEFEALWSDGRSTVSPNDAHLHYQAILDTYQREPTIPPSEIAGLAEGASEPLQVLHHEYSPIEKMKAPVGQEGITDITNGNVTIAFSSRPSAGSGHQAGCADVNREQRMTLRTPTGRLRLVPVTITNLVMDTIFQTKPGDMILIAIYGLSRRVPEYGALLDAARRGVRLQILLNRVSGHEVAARLRAFRDETGVPIEVRTAGRMMHQKYLIHCETGTVITGTANMSTDASARHWEHRIRIAGCAELAEQYVADFQQIWSRVQPDDCASTRI